MVQSVINIEIKPSSKLYCVGPKHNLIFNSQQRLVKNI